MLAFRHPRLQKIKVTLDRHNNLIFEAERERNKLEIELSDLKGLARLTKKKELESRIAIKTEADAYQKECAKWDEAYVEKAIPKTETMREKIQRYQEKADRQNARQPYRSRGKGAR